MCDCKNFLSPPVLSSFWSKIVILSIFRAGKLMLQQKELVKKVKEYNEHMENNGLSRLTLTSREVNRNLILWNYRHFEVWCREKGCFMENNGLSRLTLTSREVNWNLILWNYSLKFA